jgi:hypothetical protein
MEKNISDVAELLELVNCYPSPHNGQPIRIKQIGDTFELYFDKSRGLQSTEISLLFSFVSMGVFVQHFELAAKALGHKVTWSFQLPQEAELKGAGLVIFGKCELTWHSLETNPDLKSTILNRQTSRRKYHEGITDNTAQIVTRFIDQKNMIMKKLNLRQRDQAIWLNQRAVFDDMEDIKVRNELDHWLRYDKQQKEQYRDGLAYDCLELNGTLLKFIVHNHRILKIPGFSWILKRYYLRTMSDNSDVFYILAPFETVDESFEVGRVIIDIWIKISEAGCYLHPFGTIMSNSAAHADFVSMAGVDNENRKNSYLVFIFRTGMSNTPARSMRKPIKEHLIME